jgi:hypothetical protein
MELIGQFGHQLAEHVAAAGESVQQKDSGILWVSSLAIKDNGAHRLSFAIFDLNSVICYHTLIYYSLKSAAKIRKNPHTHVSTGILL